MFTPISLNSFSFPVFSYQFPSIDSVFFKIIDSVKEVAGIVFQKISDFFNSYDKYPHESNLKTFALLSCLSLIALLFVSMLSKRDSSIVPPPTPYNRSSSHFI